MLKTLYNKSFIFANSILPKVIIFIVLIFSCDFSEKVSEIKPKEFHCKVGKMSYSFHKIGILENIPIQGLKDEFQIIIDTTYKATNFISEEEEMAIECSKSSDTSHLTFNEDWSKLSKEGKRDYLKETQEECKRRAVKIHKEYNQGQQLIWFVNNSNDTIKLQRQDRLLIFILEAKTKNGSWSPMQYWKNSSCGNSYFIEYMPPKKARAVIYKLPNKGDFKTKFRVKLLGKDKFFYSNEFYGTMDYCEFVEDKSNYIPRKYGMQPHYTLDTLIYLANE